MLVIGTGGFSQMYEHEQVFDVLLPDLVLLGLERALVLNPAGSQRWTAGTSPARGGDVSPVPDRGRTT